MDFGLELLDVDFTSVDLLFELDQLLEFLLDDVFNQPLHVPSVDESSSLRIMSLPKEGKQVNCFPAHFESFFDLRLLETLKNDDDE